MRYEIFPSTEISFFLKRKLDRTNYICLINFIHHLKHTFNFLIGCDFNVNFVQVPVPVPACEPANIYEPIDAKTQI